jgi:hypothetical protein
MLRFTALGFFFAYTVMAAVAGLWGTVGNATWDHHWMFQLDVRELPHATQAGLLSQYRFMRAIEAGYGIVSLAYWRLIFSDWIFGRLFLSVMGLGVFARIVSLVADGSPFPIFYAFLGGELCGLAFIFLEMKAGKRANPRTEGALPNIWARPPRQTTKKG